MIIKLIKKTYRSIESRVSSLIYYKTLKFSNSCDITRGIKYLKTKRTIFHHPIGIVIGKEVELGFDCTIYQNVTIGSKFNEDHSITKYPKIGNSVSIGAGAVIIGDISIGDNVIIGANSVVINDIPNDNIVAGNPARIIRVRKNS